MIKNSLKIPDDLFKNVNIDSTKRPEDLSIGDFGKLADIIYENKINC
jgi:16S rRNA A1518/A1519 N6-dimethyltransferase RsmA/KsgA/DIM1 with predicted DNA glycosylase/AP lyase activity